MSSPRDKHGAPDVHHRASPSEGTLQILKNRVNFIL